MLKILNIHYTIIINLDINDRFYSLVLKIVDINV